MEDHLPHADGIVVDGDSQENSREFCRQGDDEQHDAHDKANERIRHGMYLRLAET